MCGPPVGGLLSFKFSSRPHPRKVGVKRFLVVREVAGAVSGVACSGLPPWKRFIGGVTAIVSYRPGGWMQQSTCPEPERSARRSDELRSEPQRGVPDEVRVRHQSHDRENAQLEHTGQANRARRRSDRITIPFAALHISLPGTKRRFVAAQELASAFGAFRTCGWLVPVVSGA